MQHPLLNFLGPSLIPELCADVTAGSSGNIHFILVLILAIGTFRIPDSNRFWYSVPHT